ncbi:MAG: META domain-containing protein, partial [Actinomycetota bacterium]|nr:META domain-containing protein [Actinomycetota bacterium]
MNRSTRLLIALFAFALVATACGDDSNTATSEVPTLDGRQFWSTSVVEDGTEHALVEGTRISLRFDDGRVGASAGCNSLGGSYTLRSGVLVARDMAMTEMGCDPERHQQDEFVVALLTAEPDVELDGDVLTLRSETVTAIFLDREVADPDRPIIGTVWQATGFIHGEVATSMAVDVAGHIVFDDQSSLRGHDGCVEFTASVEVSDGSIGGPVEGDGELQFGPRKPAIDSAAHCQSTTDYADA